MADTYQIDPKNKIGFKNVQALRAWHGRFGFLSHDPSGCCALQDDCDCCLEAEQTTPDATKYLTIERTGHVKLTYVDGNPLNTEEYTVTRKYTVNAQSGVITEVSCSGVGDDPSTAKDQAEAYARMEFSCAGFVLGGVLQDSSGPHITASGNNTSFSWSDSSGAPGTVHEASATLTDTNTSADVYADVVALLGHWDLTDDAVYPWRRDGYVSIAPLMSRNEVPGPASPDTWQDCGWVDPNAAIYDGAIKGSPLAAGYLGFWEFDHETWALCDDCSGVGQPQWEKKYFAALSGGTVGGDVTNAVVPGTARQWTNNFQGTLLPDGAWIGMLGSGGDFSGLGKWAWGSGVLAAQKWAEIQVNRPGIDFERPCGDDANLLNEPGVRCVTDYSGGIITTDSATDIATGRVGVFGVSGLTDGHYDCTRIDSTHFSITGGFAAAEYANDVGTGIIGQVRFPSAGACVSSELCNGKRGRGDYLLATWAYNFRDYQERTRAIAQYADCSGCSAVGGDPGGPIRDGQTPQSVSAFAVNGHTISSANCGVPQVMCISPNGEAWANGTTHGFAGITCDQRYGALWQAQIIQTIPDPFWQQPHRPCVECDSANTPTLCDWTEDSGGCPDDDCVDDCTADTGTKYYAQRPWVEARKEGIEECPALPEGIVLPSTLADLQPPQNVGFPVPGPCPYYDVVTPPNALMKPWVIWLYESGCVCSEESTNRFSDAYKANGVNCGVC